jgi:diaminopimelate decarboxylase
MAGQRRIDECLSARQGHLFIEECPTLDLVRKFGSPVFVYSEDQLRRNIREFQKAFSDTWPDGDVKIMPAAKANWITAVQKIIADEGCGCDIYSPGELSVALTAGFDPQYISVNGVPKDDHHIRRGINAGARITIDSVEEIEIIESAAKELGIKAQVRLRLKPAISGFTKYSDFAPHGPISTDLAAMVYKGGLPREHVIAIGQRILKSPHIELTGFHEHHGRHNRSTRYWQEQMKSFAEEMGVVCRALGGYQPKEIDIGGGFAIPRDPFNAETKYSEPYELLALHILSKGLSGLNRNWRYKVLNKLIEKFLICKPNQIYAPTIEEYGRACTSTLRRDLPHHGIETRGLMLQVEPGRGLHGNTAIHLTTVKNIKRMRVPISWNHVVLDTTEFWFTGGRYEHHLHDYIFADKTETPLVDKADIVGRSCYGDRLIPTVLVPRDVKVGDVMAILDVGAYQEVSMSNFNAMPRPATLLVTGDRASVIRRAETEEDVFQRDLVPDHWSQIQHPGAADQS